MPAIVGLLINFHKWLHQPKEKMLITHPCADVDGDRY
jgi:hypothetical protein